MNSINKTSRTNISQVDISQSTPQTSIPKTTLIKENFNFKEIILEENNCSNIPTLERKNRNILLKLFTEILQADMEIIPTRIQDYGSYVVEASFVQAKTKESKHQIKIPLRGTHNNLLPPYKLIFSKSYKNSVEEYINQILHSSNDADITRLIIVTAHEFGHYISLHRNNHDNELRLGLYLSQSTKEASGNYEYTWKVFQEECSAWYYAKQKLKGYLFIELNVFDQVKQQSLATYCKTLKLQNASLQIYFKLSQLGEDFRNAINSEYFK